MARYRCLAVLLVLAAVPPVISAQRPSPEEITRWLELVAAHRPGTNDDSVRQLSAWSWARLDPMLTSLRERAPASVVLRSAGLLLDVAVYVPVEERPILRNIGQKTVAEDGQHRSTSSLDSHLEAGRQLLEKLPREQPPADREPVRAEVIAWYRTVSMMLATRLNLADLRPHVQRALARFPSDAAVLYDAGLFYESMASPAIQAAIVVDPAPLSSERKPLKLLEDFAQSTTALQENAETYFTRAIELDPTLVPARTRLARLLIVRKRHLDAIPHLREVISQATEPTWQYLGLMLLGRAYAESGRTTDALEAFRAAAALFPEAPSPHLAISATAAEAGDAALERRTIGRLLDAKSDPNLPMDPWWLYHRAAGVDFDRVHAAYSARIQQLPAIQIDAWRAR